MEVGFLQEIKAVIRSLVVSCPGEISVGKLDKDFRETEGYPIPYGKLGFGNLESFLHSISDTIRIKGYGTTATLHYVANEKTDHIRDMIRSQKKSKRPKSKYPKHSLMNAPHYTPNVACKNNTKFPSGSKPFVRREYGSNCRPYENKRLHMQSSQNVSDTGKSVFKSIQRKKMAPVEAVEEEIEDVTTGLGQLVHISKEKIHEIQQIKERFSGEVRIKDAAKSEVFNISDSTTGVFADLDEAVPEFAANNLVFRLDFPENTMIFGKKIDSYTLPDNITMGSVIGIFISEIHNPHKFWFHIYKKNHELDILMHNIERFYTSLERDEYVLPSCCHTTGQICAALYNDLWHRAEIISLPVNNKTKVFFIDYGTVSNVNTEHIKYLASMFATIPSQAMRGALSHIKPRGLHWSHEATEYFLSEVCELMLYGQVTEIDKQNRILHMVLCNTNGSQIKQINKMLIEKKYALYDENWLDQRIAQNGKRLHHLREDFPTFDMIEKGEYPTLSELVDLQNRGIDYENIIDRKIFHHGKMNNHENAPEALRNLPFLLLNNNPFRYDIIWELHSSIKI